MSKWGGQGGPSHLGGSGWSADEKQEISDALWYEIEENQTERDIDREEGYRQDAQNWQEETDKGIAEVIENLLDYI